ncbi:MAG: NAD(P)-binding domain-containing protein, partial [Pseudomonadota bacterium]
MIQQDLPIAIIGSGPIGLAAAAHLYQLNIPFLVFEKGEQVGSNILAWSHVTFFSSWTLNMDKVCIELLENSGWTTPQDDIFPTGHEFLAQYLVPLFQLPEINNHIHLNHKVKSVSRYHTNKSSNKRDQPFELCIINDKKQTQYIYAKGVIDASGTWQNMNPIGGSGYYLKEEKTNEHITYGIPDILGENKQDYWGMI